MSDPHATHGSEDRRRARRRSSRPAGAPAPHTTESRSEHVDTPAATTRQQNARPAQTGSRDPASHAARVSNSAPKRRRSGGHSGSRNNHHGTARHAEIVMDINGKAGKAPARYTRSSSAGGPRPVTRSLTKNQTRRHRSRSLPEVSAGGILLLNAEKAYNSRTGKVSLAGIHVPVIGRTDRRNRLLWSLPKGHIEDYETVPMTAIREVREETGITGDIIKHLGAIDYWFLSDGKNIHKTVHHYLLQYVSGTLNSDDPEITRVKWVPLKELPGVLSYTDERKLARRAIGTVATWVRETYVPAGEAGDGAEPGDSAGAGDGPGNSAGSAAEAESTQKKSSSRRRRRRGGRRGNGRNNSARNSTGQSSDQNAKRGVAA